MTTRILNRLGITGNFAGHWYLSCAVDYVRKDRQLLLDVTRRLYPMIGERFGKNWCAVERGMRRSIKRCWDSESRELFLKVAGRNLGECPYTREFIEILADFIDAKEIRDKKLTANASGI